MMGGLNERVDDCNVGEWMVWYIQPAGSRPNVCRQDQDTPFIALSFLPMSRICNGIVCSYPVFSTARDFLWNTSGLKSFKAEAIIVLERLNRCGNTSFIETHFTTVIFNAFHLFLFPFAIPTQLSRTAQHLPSQTTLPFVPFPLYPPPQHNIHPHPPACPPPPTPSPAQV